MEKQKRKMTIFEKIFEDDWFIATPLPRVEITSPNGMSGWTEELGIVKQALGGGQPKNLLLHANNMPDSIVSQ